VELTSDVPERDRCVESVAYHRLPGVYGPLMALVHADIRSQLLVAALTLVLDSHPERGSSRLLCWFGLCAVSVSHCHHLTGGPCPAFICTILGAEFEPGCARGSPGLTACSMAAPTWLVPVTEAPIFP
jgi:hypothetical protein